MLLLGKIALGLGTTVAAAGVYTFHQGVVRVDVDEYRHGGTHLHIWAPAAMAPMALHFVPKRYLERRSGSEQAREGLPIARALIHELKRYDNTTFVEVQDGDQHVRVSTVDGKIKIDVTDPNENVHVLVPLSTIEDVLSQVEVNQRPD